MNIDDCVNSFEPIVMRCVCFLLFYVFLWRERDFKRRRSLPENFPWNKADSSRNLTDRQPVKAAPAVLPSDAELPVLLAC